MNKKYLVVLPSLVVLISISIGFVFADGQKSKLQKKQLESKNTAILTVDTESNEYTIEKDGKVEKGSVKQSANVDTDAFYNIYNITSIDIGKLKVTSNSNNPGNLHVKVVKTNSNDIHYSTGGLNLKPGESWITAGGLSPFTKYTIIAKASEKGLYEFTLKW